MIGIHVKYHGCPLTRLECQLVGNKWTVIDPILQLLQIEVTNQRRYKMTILIDVGILLVLIVGYINIHKFNL